MLQPVQLFKILSDETRFAIVMLLRESGELCVCDICAATSESQPKISRHMAILREAGLVLTVVKANGSTIVCHPTYRHGPLKQSRRPGSVCGRCAWMAG
jgi:DNA-binding transcriptional ArsR family regulator